MKSRSRDGLALKGLLELEAKLHALGWHNVMLHAWSTRECGGEMIDYPTF